jgi:hypothetical protein
MGNIYRVSGTRLKNDGTPIIKSSKNAIIQWINRNGTRTYNYLVKICGEKYTKAYRLKKTEYDDWYNIIERQSHYDVKIAEQKEIKRLQMVNKTITTREHEFEGDMIIAIRHDTFTNAHGKKITQTMREEGVTIDEVNNIVDTLADVELEKFATEMYDLVEKADELEAAIKETIESDDYIAFKKFVAKPETQTFFEILQKESLLQQSRDELVSMKEKNADVLAWKKEFVAIQYEYDLNKYE